MFKRLIMALAITLLSGCDTGRQFPDDIVVIGFVNNLQEATVRVGYFEKYENGQYAHPLDQTIDNAIVRISNGDSSVLLTRIADGFYIDQLHQLPIVYGDTYLLEVTVGDRIITAQTTLPFPAAITNFQDSTKITIVADNADGPFTTGDRGQKSVYLDNPNSDNLMLSYRVNQGGVFTYQLSFKDSMMVDFYFPSGVSYYNFQLSSTCYDSVGTAAYYRDFVAGDDKQWFFPDEDIKSYLNSLGDLESRSNINGGLGIFFSHTSFRTMFVGIAQH